MLPEGCRGCCMMVILVPLLICSLVVCLAIYIGANRPDAPLGNFRPSSSEALAFDSEIQRATNSARDQRWFYFQFTERQLSSWLALEGADFADDYGYSFPFDDIQVGIDDGMMTFYANVERYSIKVPLEVIIEPRVDRDGQFKLDIDSAQLGGIAMPDFVLDSITDQIETKLFDQIDKLPGEYGLWGQTLSVDNGLFEVQGQLY